MKTLKFKCELLSDVVLNQKAATEGNNSTLDFIPGSTFLGIVAAHYGELDNQVAWKIFHSGKVRFGDAHPAAADEMRTLRIPASLYYPKMKSIAEACYVRHIYEREQDKENGGCPQQLKQCRTGFYAFGEDNNVSSVVLNKSFALKSAYDRDKRRSEDEKMFGYESLSKGATFFFDVELDEDDLAEVIEKYLCGERYIGRSRTAQYGRVKISEAESYMENSSSGQCFTKKDNETKKDNNYATVYADGRLIFLDGQGELTLQPAAKDLGIEKGKIDWTRSQVRTFQYAPWNGKRGARDADRMGIEKGSVFVVELNHAPESYSFESRYVGVYNNEGFGKVIYNPSFLQAQDGKNGLSVLSFDKGTEKQGGQEETKGNSESQNPGDTPLLKYLGRCRQEQKAQRFIYGRVNDFVAKNKSRFSSEQFASQWGTIRSIAMQKRTYEAIHEELFKEKEGYLEHGVAAERWKKSQRKDNLEGFLKAAHKEEATYNDKFLCCKALVNLASEMAKIARKAK